MLVGFGGYLSAVKLIESSQWILHTIEVHNEIGKLSTSFIKTQANIRGFFINGQDYYLNLYKEDRDQIRLNLKKIRDLVIDNPTQQLTLDQLEPILEKRLASWEESILDRQKHDLETVLKKNHANESRNLNVELTTLIDRLKAEESQILDARIENIKSVSRAALGVVSFGGILALVLIGMAAYIVNRDNLRRAAAEDERDRFFTLSLDLLCISGMDGYFKRLSPAYQETLGHSLTELYSKPILDFIHPDDINKTILEIEKQSKGQKVLSFENRFRCKNGIYKTLSWKSVPVNGYMYAVARDITQQKKYEEGLIDAEQKSLQLSRAKSEFLAHMSHEIRTPLNGIIGVTDLLNGTSLSAEQDKYVRMIRDSGHILLKVINEVLDFSKIEAGKMMVEKQRFHFASFMETQISMLGIPAHEKNLKLTFSIDPRIPEFLLGDTNRIGQVLINLVGNAIKFTDRGEIKVLAACEALAETSCRVCFQIEDSGIGLSDDQIQKLFSPFTQGDSSTSRKFGGTGLGLSICKKLVEIMDGKIGVDSKKDLGSLFWFTLPLEIPVVDQTLAPISELSPGKISRSQKGLNILVAEDNHINQMIILAMLENMGHTPHLVTNGREAVDTFLTGKYDLILMDHHMPIMDGNEATIQIRQQEAGTGKRIPIIAFTANAFRSSLEADPLMDDVILKPVTSETLQKVLSKWESKADG